MKFQWTANNFGRSGILAIPEGADTQPPVDTFYLDYIIETIDPDRLAIAATLAFGAYATDRLKFDNPVSAGVARAIEGFRNTARVRVEPVRYTENNSVHGDSVIVLCHTGVHNIPRNELGRQRHIGLSVLPTETCSGGLLTMDSLSVASNAWLHAQLSPTQSGHDHASLAAGILLSADLSAAGIAMCRSSASRPPESGPMQELLESVGLSFAVQSCD